MFFFTITIPFSIFLAFTTTEVMAVFMNDHNDYGMNNNVAEKYLNTQTTDNKITNKTLNSTELLSNIPHEDNTYKRKRLPILPEDSCEVGKVYRTKDNCNRCFCKDDGQAKCTTNSPQCKKKLSVYVAAIKNVADIRPPMEQSEIDGLEQITHFASKCEAGKEYKISCNVCACLGTGELICDNLFCLNYDKTLGVKAETYNTNLPAKCTEADEKAIDEIIECKCSEMSVTRLSCYAKPGNYTAPDDAVLVLDITKEKCQPGMAYDYRCNTCYCQDDKVLRCGQEFCVYYNDSMNIQKAVANLL